MIFSLRRHCSGMLTKAAGAFAMLLCATSASPIPLFGYLCSTCPGDKSPSAILDAMPHIYSHVGIAFAGWDASGNILNQWDAPERGFVVNEAVVAKLKARGVRVFLSAGGGAANVLPGEFSHSLSFSPSSRSIRISQLSSLILRTKFERT